MLFLEHKSLEISKAKPSFMLARVRLAMGREGKGSLFVASHHIRSRPRSDRDILLLLWGDYCGDWLLMLFPSGNTDIQNGNMKLILGLIWSLIAHYQLGASNFPPKKLMLAWLKVSAEQSRLPHCREGTAVLQCTGCCRLDSYFLFRQCTLLHSANLAII